MSVNSPTGNLFLDVIIGSSIFIGICALFGGLGVFIYFIFEEVSDRRRYKKAAHGAKVNSSQEHTEQEEALFREFAQISSSVTFLMEETLKETARQEALQGKELKVDKLAALLHAVSREMQELHQQVWQLTLERDALRQEGSRLTRQLQVAGNDNDREPDPY